MHRNILFSLITQGILSLSLNTLRPKQNGCTFPDDIFKCIFLMKIYKFRLMLHCQWSNYQWSMVQLSMVNGTIINIQALVQIKAWRLPGYKPLFQPMMVSLLTHIRVTRPQRVNGIRNICSRCRNTHPIVLCGKYCFTQCLYSGYRYISYIVDFDVGVFAYS